MMSMGMGRVNQVKRRWRKSRRIGSSISLLKAMMI